MTDISTYMRQARSRRGVDPRTRLGVGWTHEESRAWLDALSDHVGDWQGIPVPLGEETPLTLAAGHPLRDFFRDINQTGGVEIELVVDTAFERRCGIEDVREDERVINEWFCRQRNCRVLVMQTGGRYYALTVPVSPDRSMDRLSMWLTTMGAADAWDLDAEHAARDTLRAMLSDRQWMHYDLTGCFFETSPRSRVTYLFRRLRPTIALSPRGKNGDAETMRCLATLCLHPIGYYSRTWGGCMVPSDDVMAHLAWMRGDEAGFWKHANQHPLSAPEAGL